MTRYTGAHSQRNIGKGIVLSENVLFDYMATDQ